jgi:precorrin-6A/cobalt-precorrin-6A reductase
MEVGDVSKAVTALGESPQRVFLALGRQDLQAFVCAPQHHYVIRSVDPVDPPLAVPHARYILARGPFEEAADHDLLRSNRIDRVVAKNSGGEATYSKIAAARSLGIEVVFVRRPPDLAQPSAETVEEAVRWIDRALG